MPVYPKNTAPLTSLPMRITQLQRTRLEAAREHDHIAIQEHVRRALDEYLDRLEKRRSRSDIPGDHPMVLTDGPPLQANIVPTIEQANRSLERATGASAGGRRKVVYR